MSNHSDTRTAVASAAGEALTLDVHPEAIFCADYVTTQITPEEYEPLRDGFELADTDETGATLTGDEQLMRIDACDEGIVRIRVNPTERAIRESTTERLGLITGEWPGAAFRATVRGEEVELGAGEIRVGFNTASKELEVATSRGSVLRTRDGGIRFSRENGECGGNRMLAFFELPADEHFFGFGGRTAPVDRRGRSVDVFSTKVGKLYGDYGGFPLPFFVSSNGYGLFFNNPWPHVYFDMGKTFQDRWFVHAPGGECDLFVIDGPRLQDIVRRYTSITGRVPVPEKKLFGLWVSSLALDTADKAVDTARRMREEQWPSDIVVLDGPWRGGPDFVPNYKKYHEYLTNDVNWHERFGDGPAMIRSLHEMDYDVALHLNSRNFKRETYQDAIPKGLLRKHGEEVVPMLEDEAGEEFFAGHLEPRIEEGVDLWWTDHTDRVSGEIFDGVPSRNLFGPLWNRLIHRLMAEHGKGNHLSLSRGGGIGGQRYALPWPGDTAIGIERFEEDIWYMLNAGLGGYAITSVDMAGFTLMDNDLPDEEAYATTFSRDNILRRLLHSVFITPAPRLHNNFTGIPKFPWNCPQEYREMYRAFLELRYRFTPYFYSYAVNASRTGDPIVRPLVYHFQDDPQTYEIGNELMIGDWLLVAPVTEAEASVRDVYLPEGVWIDYWTDAHYEGPARIEVPVPYDSLRGMPMFVRSGGIIPTQPVVAHLDDAPPRTLFLDVYPDGESALSLNEGAELTSVMVAKRDPESLQLGLANATAIEREYAVTIHDAWTDPVITAGGERVSHRRPADRPSSVRFTLSMQPGSEAIVRIAESQGA